jgi:hypothetical protein
LDLVVITNKCPDDYFYYFYLKMIGKIEGRHLFKRSYSDHGEHDHRGEHGQHSHCADHHGEHGHGHTPPVGEGTGI